MTPAILIFAASARSNSINKKLARQAAATAERLGAKASFIDLQNYPMPLYDGDLEQERGIPEKAAAFAELIRNHDGLIIASPEYNGAFTPLLKNTIDWATRVDYRILADKTIGLMSASPGKGGGGRGLELVRQWFANMGLIVTEERFSLAQAPQAFQEDGGLAGEKQLELESFIRQLLQAIGDKEQIAA